MTAEEISQLLKDRNVADGYFIVAVWSTILGRMIHYHLSDDEILTVTSGLLNMLHSALADSNVVDKYNAFTDALNASEND